MKFTGDRSIGIQTPRSTIGQHYSVKLSTAQVAVTYTTFAKVMQTRLGQM